MSGKKPSPKKKYSTPKLVRYGDFKKITMGSNTQNNDNQNQSGANKTRSSTG